MRFPVVKNINVLEMIDTSILHSRLTKTFVLLYVILYYECNAGFFGHDQVNWEKFKHLLCYERKAIEKASLRRYGFRFSQ